MKKLIIFSATIFLFCACQQENKHLSFEQDLSTLERLDDLSILQQGTSMLATSPALHGQIFAISSNGRQGINRCYFDRAKIKDKETPLKPSSLGGASRLMFGPQFGPYNVFFRPGMEQSDDNVRSTNGMDQGDFELTHHNDSSIHCAGELKIENAQDYTFDLHIERHITLHSASYINRHLKIKNATTIEHIGFTVTSSMCNIGKEQWSKNNGLLSLWDLSCMLPADDNIAILPMTGSQQHLTNYFTPLDASRMRIVDHTAYYKADAKYMNKIGLLPQYCRPIYGAYSASLKQLVINTYSLDSEGTYVNSEKAVRPPYKGDVINIFNGEVNAAEGRNWPFYELESSSPTSELRPGEEIRHRHSLFIFVGEEEELASIAQQTLGVSLKGLSSMFE